MVAGTAGLLVVAAALAVGHFVAGLLLEPSASPHLAVGNAAIDRTPQPVKDFAIEQFGTNDKLVLLLGMAVVLAFVGVVVGLVSRRRALPGVAIVAALVAGLAVFWWLHELGRRRVRQSATREPDARQASAEERDGAPVREERTGALARRPFLTGARAVAAGAATAGFSGTLLANRVDVQSSRRAIGRIEPSEPAPPIPPRS